MCDLLMELFGVRKPIVGMAHFLPLPGSYLYDDARGVKGIVEALINDVEALQEGGVDGIMFCNENDRPYSFKAGPGTIATMAYVIGCIKSHIKVPFGVDVLWDPIASLSLAKATGALFIREIFTNVYAGDMGLWLTNCNEAFVHRKLLGAEEIKLFFNINAEFSQPLAERAPSLVARSVIMSSLPDALLISGPTTGSVAEMSLFEEIKQASGKVPVLANTGVTADTVDEVLSIVDGAIIGTYFKVDGITWNPVSKDRVKRVMDRVKRIREKLT
ncbi:MAG: BtpA/SgcQ family protein [Actinobacteria bacterium]|nr:BtpA/SgcQ family protein [Actinomycetota bacterium]